MKIPTNQPVFMSGFLLPLFTCPMTGIPFTSTLRRCGEGTLDLVRVFVATIPLGSIGLVYFLAYNNGFDMNRMLNLGKSLAFKVVLLSWQCLDLFKVFFLMFFYFVAWEITMKPLVFGEYVWCTFSKHEKQTRPMYSELFGSYCLKGTACLLVFQ